MSSQEQPLIGLHTTTKHIALALKLSNISSIPPIIENVFFTNEAIYRDRLKTGHYLHKKNFLLLLILIKLPYLEQDWHAFNYL